MFHLDASAPPFCNWFELQGSIRRLPPHYFPVIKHTMPLSSPVERKAMQRRCIEFQGFLRNDGLWEVEGVLRDTKPFEFRDYRNRISPAGRAVHQMSVRLTLDDNRIVMGAEASIDSAPYPSCFDVSAGVKAMVGARVGEGWKAAVRARLPMHQSCTHLSELLVAMATAVFQTQAYGKSPEGKNPFEQISAGGKTPFFLDKCRSWKVDGEVVREVFPVWFKK